METVSLSTLLEVMDMERLIELKQRGKLVITKRAPHAEVLFSSIPSRYRHKLIVVR